MLRNRRADDGLPEKSSLQIGVSGAEKNYLKMPWSIEDTIENLEELKEMMQQKLIMTNYHGRGEKDAEEIAFDFNRAIQALKENREYKQLGTLEEVREAMERQQEKQIINISKGDKLRFGTCPICNRRISTVEGGNYCQNCGQRLNWSDKG